MITAEQRKKLQAEVRHLYPVNWDEFSEFLLAGAEALDRIQSESSESDEEATIAYLDANRMSAAKANEAGKAYLAGCARYRPLVEEMLDYVKGYDGPQSERDALIARAEKLLGEKK